MSHLEVIAKVQAGNDLSLPEMSQAIGQMMDGTWADDDIAELLLALNEKGPAVDEIAGAATAMRNHMIQINAPGKHFIDTCGTGGDQS